LDSPGKILIIKLSSIGDVVHALPFLEAVKNRHPASHIDWLIEEEASQIISGHPLINRIIVSKRKSWEKEVLIPLKLKKTFSEAKDFYKDIRTSSYDIVVDLQGLFRSGFLAAISKGKRKIGMSGGREGASFFLNEPPVPVDYNQHAIDRYLKLAAFLDCETGCFKGEIPVFEKDRKKADEILLSFRKSKQIIAINPMAKWKTKLWEPDKFSELALRLVEAGDYEVIFTGSASDRPVIDNILGKTGKDGMMNLAGMTNLKELAHIYSKCSVLICTDTGPMHIAAAMGCRVVALFGPTSPLRTGPYGPGHMVIKSKDGCGPCFKKECVDPKCMKDISVDMVMDEVKKVL
jgi:3-deoxy-D-manno-octulosonic-acid transferase/heptosyltransferase-1